LLTGCAIGPDYHRPAVQTPTTFRAPTPQPAPEAASLADLKWWEVFKDEKLQELIRTSLVENYDLRDAVARVINPSTLRWISFSHFEADECGALNEWLHLAPHAQPACGLVGALVSVNDFALRRARVVAQDETLKTGKYRFRFRQTPHVPHNWEAGLLFEEVTRTLLCSDLFSHEGDAEPVIDSDVVDRAS